MTVADARKWLILASLIVTGVQIFFLLVAPAIGVPLEFKQSINLLQIVTPVFLGYLGSAAHFAFMTPPPPVTADNDLLRYLVKGPILIYAIAMVAAFGAFTYSNRPGVMLGTGMSIDDLSTAVSICLGILAAVTGVLVTYLFAVQRRKEAEAENRNLVGGTPLAPPPVTQSAQG
ncbi:hypothetical protein [Mesorhizobium sp. M0586]|uniref:hypothetical protein n=1 Tax=unclassified Mesorhizobium TaxID=325217 RepID=UPI003335DC48